MGTNETPTYDYLEVRVVRSEETTDDLSWTKEVPTEPLRDLYEFKVGDTVLWCKDNLKYEIAEVEDYALCKEYRAKLVSGHGSRKRVKHVPMSQLTMDRS